MLVHGASQLLAVVTSDRDIVNLKKQTASSRRRDWHRFQAFALIIAAFHDYDSAFVISSFSLFLHITWEAAHRSFCSSPLFLFSAASRITQRVTICYLVPGVFCTVSWGSGRRGFPPAYMRSASGIWQYDGLGWEKLTRVGKPLQPSIRSWTNNVGVILPLFLSRWAGTMLKRHGGCTWHVMDLAQFAWGAVSSARVAGDDLPNHSSWRSYRH